MNPDDKLHEHWIYMLPNGKHVEAVKGEDNRWRLWEYVSCWQGDRAGSGSYWDFKGMRRTNHYVVTESGEIIGLSIISEEICTLDDIEDTGYTLNIESGVEIPRKKAIEDRISYLTDPEKQASHWNQFKESEEEDSTKNNNIFTRPLIPEKLIPVYAALRFILLKSAQASVNAIKALVNKLIHLFSTLLYASPPLL